MIRMRNFNCLMTYRIIVIVVGKLLLSITTFFLLFSINCERAPNQPNKDGLTIELLPQILKLATTDTVRLSVTVKNTTGEILTGKAVKWKISDTTIIRYLGDGVIRGIKEGQAYSASGN